MFSYNNLPRKLERVKVSEVMWIVSIRVFICPWLCGELLGLYNSARITVRDNILDNSASVLNSESEAKKFYYDVDFESKLTIKIKKKIRTFPNLYILLKNGNLLSDCSDKLELDDLSVSLFRFLEHFSGVTVSASLGELGVMVSSVSISSFSPTEF